MQVSYFETGRYYAPSNLPRQRHTVGISGS
jgi:hypothetical protein